MGTGLIPTPFLQQLWGREIVDSKRHRLRALTEAAECIVEERIPLFRGKQSTKNDQTVSVLRAHVTT